METNKFNAFISYPRTKYGIAVSIKNALEKFARKQLNISKSLRIFLDQSNLTPGPDLSQSLQNAIKASDYFILIASKDSAKSIWVKRELEFFCELQASTTRVIIVLADGEILWDEAALDFDRNRTNALPVTTKNYFTSEPLYLDVRNFTESQLTLKNEGFLDVIATISAVIHDTPKDKIIGTHLNELKAVYKRFRLNIGLSAMLGSIAGALIVLLSLFQQNYTPLLSVPVTCFVAAIIAWSVMGFKFKTVACISLSFAFVSLLYLFTTIIPLNYNTWDIIAETLLLSAGFCVFGLSGKMLQPAVKNYLTCSFSMAGLLATITWFFTKQYFPLSADFRIYQPEWFFTRMKLCYHLFYDDFSQAEFNVYFLVPLLIWFIVGSILFGVLYAGKDFTEITTLDNRILAFYNKIRIGKNKKVYGAFAVLIAVFNLYTYTGIYEKQLIQYNLKGFDKAATERAESGSFDDTAIVFSQPVDSAIDSYTAANDKIQSLFENADAQLKKNDTVSAVHSLQQLQALATSSKDGDINTALLGKIVSRYFKANTIAKARSNLDTCFNVINKFYNTKNAGSSRSIWFEEETGPAIYELGYWEKLPFDLKFEMDVFNTVMPFLGDSELIKIMNDKRYLLNSSNHPVTVIASLAKNKRWNTALLLLNNYPTLFNGNGLLELCKIAYQQKNSNIQQLLKQKINEALPVVKKEQHDFYNADYADLIQAYAVLGEPELAEKTINNEIFDDVIAAYLTIAEQYINQKKFSNAYNSVQKAWYLMHRKNGRISLFCEELNRAANLLLSMKHFRLAIFVTEEGRNENHWNDNEELIQQAFLNLLNIANKR